MILRYPGHLRILVYCFNHTAPRIGIDSMRRFSIGSTAVIAFGLGQIGEAADFAPTIRTDDVTRFFEIYDAANGRPQADVLQRHYIESGSPGLNEFVPYRIVSGENLAAAITANPETYTRARDCLPIIPKTKAKLYGALRKLRQVYSSTRMAPVTIVVGAGNSGGTSGPSGVIIGLEVVCGANWLQPDLSDRLFVLVMHEYGHVEQPVELNDESAQTTVLRQSLIEGVAELIAKLTTGEVSNSHLMRWTAGREQQIGEAFLRDANSHDLKPWLYNGHGTVTAPGDLGYWVGYGIAQSYFDRAADKQSAIKALLELRDPAAILANSGWRPGYVAH